MFLNADESAALLGVSVETLYSYVSRKRIRTQPVPGTRKRLYWREDIERVKEGLWKRSPAPAAIKQDTAITLLTPTGLHYRGEDAIVLAETWTLEQVAALLWEVNEDAAFGNLSFNVPPELAAVRAALASTAATDRAMALLPLLESANPRAYDMSHPGMCRTGADVLRWLCAIMIDAPAPAEAPLHEQIAASIGGDEAAADLLRRTLVLSADYGLAAGTFAVRSIASTGVSAYRSVLAGLALTAGRRSRLGHPEAVWRLLDEVGVASDPRSVIVQRLREGSTVPGFQSREPYEDSDPRAVALLAAIEKVHGDRPLFGKAMKAAEAMLEVTGLPPSFILANVLMGQLIGLAPTQVPYMLGRCAGWIAHSIEQYQKGEIFAPATIYMGKLPPDKH